MAMPHSLFMDALLYFAVGFAAVIPLFFFNVRYALKLGLIDWPKARGLAEDQVPIVGPSLVIVVLATLGFLVAFTTVSAWVVTSACIIALMGFFDDRRPLPALDKLFFQILCSAAVVYLDPQISSSIVGLYGSWGLLASLFFMVSAMNAVNFVDGIDGLAGVVLLCSFGAVPLIGAAHPGSYPYIILCCVSMGALIPFLYLNVQKRRGFLGNIGSYFLSFIVSVAHLSLPIETSDAVSRLCLSALCFLIPLCDAATVIVVRALSGRSPFKPDKGHLHHRLVQTNIPLRYTLAVLGMIQLLGTATAVYFCRLEIVATPQLSIVIFAGYGVVTSTLILLLERASRIRVQLYFQRLDAGEPIYYLKYKVSRRDKASLRPGELQRMEAKFAAEIRVTDICVAQDTDCLFIVLRTLAEPLKGISTRLESVIHSEKQYDFLLTERGDFAKRLVEKHAARKTA